MCTLVVSVYTGYQQFMSCKQCVATVALRHLLMANRRNSRASITPYTDYRGDINDTADLGGNQYIYVFATYPYKYAANAKFEACGHFYKSSVKRSSYLPGEAYDYHF